MLNSRSSLIFPIWCLYLKRRGASRVGQHTGRSVSRLCPQWRGGVPASLFVCGTQLAAFVLHKTDRTIGFCIYSFVTALTCCLDSGIISIIKNGE